ncbi:ATP phosphoribosyltransferase regulatory subunit [Campylobacter mucosalis]|uniref:ATP phosphoribosyltransferase regulatory subunit n=1 Tax=Campylobacter mucosalis TaxID=202 RepID=UPI00146FF734|nr:ATP phosphoribosyltransferase regulatory subunit [Campylobacter mucosalis]
MKDESLKVYEHEIPVGSRLYFAKSASTKRQIEQRASQILDKEGFLEIVTPFFSYHQHLSVPPTQLLRFSDSANHEISLRADSTLDVVRIVRARIKDELHKKWYYIQPVFRYPSSEIYQIGAESIGESGLKSSICIVATLLNEFKTKATLQISNIEIPKTIAKILNLDIEVFEKVQVEKILSFNVDWLNKLALLTNLAELKQIISQVPSELKQPLQRLEQLAQSANYDDIRVVPLYYSKMRYYDKLFFRFLADNAIIASGGNYEIDGEQSSGFAIYTDSLIEKL